MWHHGTWLVLFQVMAYRLFGTKPLPGSMLTYCQFDSDEKTSVKILIKMQIFSF